MKILEMELLNSLIGPCIPVDKTKTLIFPMDTESAAAIVRNYLNRAPQNLVKYDYVQDPERFYEGGAKFLGNRDRWDEAHAFEIFAKLTPEEREFRLIDETRTGSMSWICKKAVDRRRGVVKDELTIKPAEGSWCPFMDLIFYCHGTIGP